MSAKDDQKQQGKPIANCSPAVGSAFIWERALNQAACDLSAKSVTKEELATLREENRELRIMCAIAHARLDLYTDDGELQDNREPPFIDWKQDAVSVIEAKLRERLVRRRKAEAERRKNEPNAQCEARRDTRQVESEPPGCRWV